MKSALKLVAFAGGDQCAGIVALLEAAMEALDESGAGFVATYVDMALNAMAFGNLDEAQSRDFEGIGSFQ